LLVKIDQERRKRVLGQPEDQIRVEHVLRGRQTLEFVPKARAAVPEMDSLLSYENIETVLEYKPIDVVASIAPRPILFIGGTRDDVCTPDRLAEFHARAAEPKQLAMLECEHYEIYQGSFLEESARLASEFVGKYL
jgi:fermentation-respiration switch protein FrsA (DUF1100 family)